MALDHRIPSGWQLITNSLIHWHRPPPTHTHTSFHPFLWAKSDLAQTLTWVWVSRFKTWIRKWSHSSHNWSSPEWFPFHSPNMWYTVLAEAIPNTYTHYINRKSCSQILYKWAWPYMCGGFIMNDNVLASGIRCLLHFNREVYVYVQIQYCLMHYTQNNSI